MVPRSLIDETLPAALHGVPDAAALAAEARRLAEELGATRRSLCACKRPDPALLAKMTRCYDRLDDISETIGESLVRQIYAAAASAAAPQ